MSRHNCRRCDWRPEAAEDAFRDADQLAMHHFESGHPLCIVCGLSLEWEERQTCIECVATVRTRLAQIVDYYALLPAELGNVAATPPDPTGRAGADETRLPGGDALTLLSPGSAGAFWRGRDSEPSRLDRTPWRAVQDLRNPTEDRPAEIRHANDNLPADPPSAAFELSRWEDVWRETRGEPAADQPATVSGAVAYLSPNAGWAGMYHEAFDEFADDVRKLHRSIKDAVGASDRPEVGVPCFEPNCGARLTREYGQDTYRCPRCRRTYLHHEYLLAVRDEMERKGRAS